MTSEEIKALIDRYDICDNRDGRMCIRNARGITAAEKRALAAAKPEILAYFAAEREAQEAAQRQKLQRFEAIAGIKELRAVREALHEWRRKFERAMERGDGILPSCAYTSADEKALCEKYPGAVFALSVDARRHGANYELSAIAQKAYDALCDGQDWQAVKAVYEADDAEFVQRHIWD